MSQYVLILMWIALFVVLGIVVKTYRIEYVQGKKVQRMAPFWATVLVSPLIIWTANRDPIGDTYSYIKMYSNLPSNIGNLFTYMETVEKDRGFYFLSALIKSVVGDDVKIYFFLLATLQGYLLIRLYRKYSTNIVISFFLFVASTDYLSWMYNGVRQFTAVTITLLAFEFVVEKNYTKAMIIILVASLFHQSALLVLPFVFVVQGKAWNRKTILFIALIIVAVSFVEQFTSLLDNMLQETQYENVVSDWQMWEDDGTNVIRVLVYSIPSMLSLIGLKYIRREDDTTINICTNMTIVSVGLYVISAFTSGIFMGRLPIYFSLYGYILLPWEIHHIFEEKSARIINMLMVAAYLTFYFYQIKFTWGLI